MKKTTKITQDKTQTRATIPKKFVDEMAVRRTTGKFEKSISNYKTVITGRKKK